MGYDLSAESRTVFRSMEETLNMWRSPAPHHDMFKEEMFELFISTKSKTQMYQDIRPLYLEIFEAAAFRSTASHPDPGVLQTALRFVYIVRNCPEYRSEVVGAAYDFARRAGIA